MRNSVVFSLLWNCPSVVDEARKVSGRSFQTRGPETAKLRDPSDLHVLLNEDNDGQCWLQSEHTLLSDEMKLSRVYSVDACIDNGTQLVRYSLTDRQPV